MPKVSIILPSYNHGAFLSDRLNSIVNQTFKDWELIIIDDRSTDGSLEILTDFVNQNKTKIKYFIVNEVNSKSGYFSWEKGIALADSEYVWIAETDDYSDVNFLEEQIAVLEQHKNCALVFCASNYVDVNKQFLLNSDRRTKDLAVKEGEYKVFEGSVFVDKMPFNTYITNGSSVVFRKPKGEIPHEVFIHRQCSDLFLWTFLLQNASFAFLNKKRNYFRRHEDSTTTKISSGKQLIGTYKELVFYLKYYNFPDKYSNFITYYFNNYLWKNKEEVFNVKVFENNKELKKLYFQKLIPLVIKKLFNGK